MSDSKIKNINSEAFSEWLKAEDRKYDNTKAFAKAIDYHSGDPVPNRSVTMSRWLRGNIPGSMTVKNIRALSAYINGEHKPEKANEVLAKLGFDGIDNAESVASRIETNTKGIERNTHDITKLQNQVERIGKGDLAESESKQFKGMPILAIRLQDLLKAFGIDWRTDVEKIRAALNEREDIETLINIIAGRHDSLNAERQYNLKPSDVDGLRLLLKELTGTSYTASQILNFAIPLDSAAASNESLQA